MNANEFSMLGLPHCLISKHIINMLRHMIIYRPQWCMYLGCLRQYAYVHIKEALSRWKAYNDQQAGLQALPVRV